MDKSQFIQGYQPSKVPHGQLDYTHKFITITTTRTTTIVTNPVTKTIAVTTITIPITVTTTIIKL